MQVRAEAVAAFTAVADNLAFGDFLSVRDTDEGQMSVVGFEPLSVIVGVADTDKVAVTLVAGLGVTVPML